MEQGVAVSNIVAAIAALNRALQAADLIRRLREALADG